MLPYYFRVSLLRMGVVDRHIHETHLFAMEQLKLVLKNCNKRCLSSDLS